MPPMLAKATARIPTSDGYSFEPKWDEPRSAVFRS
jgi:ATP-dependent DNA ligase